MSAKRKLWGRILKGALVALLTLGVLLWGIKAYRDARYFDDYDPTAPLNIAEGETTRVNKEVHRFRTGGWNPGECAAGGSFWRRRAAPWHNAASLRRQFSRA